MVRSLPPGTYGKTRACSTMLHGEGCGSSSGAFGVPLEMLGVLWGSREVRAFWQGLGESHGGSWGLLRNHGKTHALTIAFHGDAGENAGLLPRIRGKMGTRSIMLHGGGSGRRRSLSHGTRRKRRAPSNCIWRFGSEDLSRTLLVASS